MNAQIYLTLNLTDDTILLDEEGVLNALDWPRQVQMLLNKDEKMLLLRACTVNDLQTVVVPESETALCEISGRSFLRKIRHMVGLRMSPDVIAVAGAEVLRRVPYRVKCHSALSAYAYGNGGERHRLGLPAAAEIGFHRPG